MGLQLRWRVATEETRLRSHNNGPHVLTAIERRRSKKHTTVIRLYEHDIETWPATRLHRPLQAQGNLTAGPLLGGGAPP
jgi:hypothetical protein